MLEISRVLAFENFLSIVKDNSTGGQLEADSTFTVSVNHRYLTKIQTLTSFTFKRFCIPLHINATAVKDLRINLIFLQLSRSFKFYEICVPFQFIKKKNTNDGSVYTNRVSTFQNVILHGWHLFHVAFSPRSQVLHAMSLVHIWADVL